MVHEFRDTTELALSLNRISIFILFGKLLSHKVSLYDP